MILKQKIAIATAGISFILAAGLIETRPIISVLLILVMGGAVVVGGYKYYCSVCDKEITYDDRGEEVFSDYCPYCRAILDEPVNEEQGKVNDSVYLKLSPKKEKKE